MQSCVTCHMFFKKCNSAERNSTLDARSQNTAKSQFYFTHSFIMGLIHDSIRLFPASSCAWMVHQQGLEPRSRLLVLCLPGHQSLTQLSNLLHHGAFLPNFGTVGCPLPNAPTFPVGVVANLAWPGNTANLIEVCGRPPLKKKKKKQALPPRAAAAPSRPRPLLL